MAIYNGTNIRSSFAVTQGVKRQSVETVSSIFGNKPSGVKKAYVVKGDNAKPFNPNFNRGVKKRGSVIQESRMRLGKRRPPYLMGIGIPQPTSLVKVIEQVDFQPRVFPINYRWVKKKN